MDSHFFSHFFRFKLFKLVSVWAVTGGGPPIPYLFVIPLAATAALQAIVTQVMRPESTAYLGPYSLATRCLCMLRKDPIVLHRGGAIDTFLLTHYSLTYLLTYLLTHSLTRISGTHLFLSGRLKLKGVPNQVKASVTGPVARRKRTSLNGNVEYNH